MKACTQYLTFNTPEKNFVDKVAIFGDNVKHEIH